MAANDNSKNRRSNGGDNLLKERGEWDLKGDAEGFKWSITFVRKKMDTGPN